MVPSVEERETSEAERGGSAAPSEREGPRTRDFLIVGLALGGLVAAVFALLMVAFVL